MRLSGLQLAPVYHRLRTRFGLPAFEDERIRRQKLLHPEEKPALVLTQQDEKRLRMALLAVGAGCLLTAAAALAWKPESYTTLTRPDYGDEEEEKLLSAQLGQEDYEIPVTLDPLQVTEAEWEKLWRQAWDSLQTDALGENSAWDDIRSDLNLVTETAVPGISVEWSSSEPEWIGSSGRLGDPETIPDGSEVILTAVLSDESFKQEQQLRAVLRTSPLTEEERITRLLTQRVREAAGNRQEEEIFLPGEFQGKPLRFRRTDGTPPVIFLLLGILCAAAVWTLPGQREQETEKKRRKELEASYPELVSTITVLMGAGLTVRGAWERMVLTYRRSLLGGGAPSVLYDEMNLTFNSLSQGTFEEAAYQEFGRRCGLQPYLRLGSLLESNLKMGSRGLIPLLKEEAENALETRLREVRKQGEETSTKLLVPMILLFGLVMAMLIVPAFLSI